MVTMAARAMDQATMMKAIVHHLLPVDEARLARSGLFQVAT